MLRRIILVLWVAALMVAMVVASTFPAFAKPPRDPSQIVSDAGGSNLGVCSSFLGRQQLRDDVNRIINSGAIPEIDNPGELFEIRAKEHPQGSTPEQECQQR